MKADGWQVEPLGRSLGAHADAWDELNRRGFGGHPMRTARFFDGLLRHFGDGREVLWGSAEESEQKAQVLALLLEEKGRVFDVSVPGSPTAR